MPKVSYSHAESIYSLPINAGSGLKQVIQSPSFIKSSKSIILRRAWVKPQILYAQSVPAIVTILFILWPLVHCFYSRYLS